MNTFQINLLIISGLSLFFWASFLYLTRGIKTVFDKSGGDNGNLIRAAASSNLWRWPSDMHVKTYVGTSTHQRDTTVLLLVIFQKIFRDKKSEFPLTALWAFTHAVSVCLIYLIGSYFWNSNIALVLSVFYLISFWPWQMSLFVAHLNVGTMFFLLATYCAIQSIGTSLITTNIMLVGSGILFASMIFASSSSPRYILSFFAAVLFAANKTASAEMSLSGFYQTIMSHGSLLASLVLTLFFIICLILLKTYYKKIITAIYNRKAGFLNNLIEAKKYSLDHYLTKSGEMLKQFLKLIIKPYIFCFLVANLVGFGYFIPIFIGFILVFFALMLPNVKKNFGFYFRYAYGAYVSPRGQFVRYVKYGFFAKKGMHDVSPLARGGGFWWVPKIFFRMAPFHTLVYVGVFISLILVQPTSLGTFTLIVVASLLPILWAELTSATQVSRAYSSGLVGFLVLLGLGASVFEGYQFFWPSVFFILAITLAWNLWKFFSMVYPARMSFNKIVKVINSLKIKEIYTYKTFYNDSFIDNVSDTPALSGLKINYMKSVKEVNDGWIFIPPTSQKAGYIPQDESIQNGDFTEDPILNKILDGKRIEKISSFKFQTVYGSDNIWLHEGEVTSYLDLMVHDITDQDRFRGYAWILHSSKL